MVRNIDVWIKALSDVKNTLIEHNANYFLDTGTLLGAIRDKQFIPWDNDIDLGVVGGNISDIIAISKSLYKKGYNVTATKTNICVFKSNEYLDIGIKFYEIEDSRFIAHLGKVNGSRFFSSLDLYLSDQFILKKGYKRFKLIGLVAQLINNCRFVLPTKFIRNRIAPKIKYTEVIVSIPCQLLSSFEQYMFYNEYYNIPQNVNEYLVLRYGEDWNIPNDAYDYTKDDKSAIR